MNTLRRSADLEQNQQAEQSENKTYRAKIAVTETRFVWVYVMAKDAHEAKKPALDLAKVEDGSFPAEDEPTKNYEIVEVIERGAKPSKTRQERPRG